MISRKKIFIVVILVLFGFVISSSSCMGKGEIQKACMYVDETSIEGAQVHIEELEADEFTDENGHAWFYDVPAGTYTISVDIDGDGAWDSTEVVTLAAGESLFLLNWYPLPLKQELE